MDYAARFVVVLMVAFGLSITPAVADRQQRAPVAVPDPMDEVYAAVAGIEYVGVVRVEEAVAGLELSVGTFISDVQAAEYRASLPVAAAVVPSSLPRLGSGSGGGGCGGATNGADQFIARESGGNPQVFNPSGAYGCYQIMPGTWASSCSDLDSYGNASPAVQAECASRLPLSAWNG